MGLKDLYHYLGQNEEPRKALDFWQWFQAHQAAYLFINHVAAIEKERLLGELLRELHRYNPHLFFEMGENEGGDHPELLFTAEGVAEHFPSLQLLWEMAPEISDWKFIAFKPPIGHDFSIEIAGRVFDPREVQFIPLPGNKARRGVKIRVCYPDFEGEKQQLFFHGTHYMLHALLGEKANALDIEYLEIGGDKGGSQGHHKRPLSEIATYIAEQKARKG